MTVIDCTQDFTRFIPADPKVTMISIANVIAEPDANAPTEFKLNYETRTDFTLAVSLVEATLGEQMYDSLCGPLVYSITFDDSTYSSKFTLT